MARPDVNRFGEMEVFIRVVETGGFTAAAQQCGMTPSAVSKLVARLEDRLGARLFNRSTRRQQLTAEGAAFYERSLRILADLDEAEREASASAEPQGRVRISCNLPVGRQFLIPALPLFFERYPGVSLDLQLTDEVVDLLEVRADVAVRSGPLRDSRLVARSLGSPGTRLSPHPSTWLGTVRHSIRVSWTNTTAWASATGASSRTGHFSVSRRMPLSPAATCWPATVTACVTWRWPGWGWRGWRSFRCAEILLPAGW